MMTRILAIWLPRWSIQRFLQTAPEWRQRLVVQYHSTRRGRVVAERSPAASQSGIDIDMPLAEAKAMLRGDEVHWEAWDPRLDREALETLAVWCHQFSPHVSLEDSDHPSTLLLDVTGPMPLFGGADALLAQVGRAFERLGLVACTGLAGTVGAAWALAHFGGSVAELPEKASAEAQVAVPLKDLPVEALRLDSQTLVQLQRLGLQKLHHIDRLPRSELQTRFGDQLLLRLDQLTGAASEIPPPVAAPLEFKVEWLFEYPVGNRASLVSATNRLIERLCQGLREREAGVTELTCTLHLEEAPDEQIVVGLCRASADPQHVSELFQVHLERWSMATAVEAITLEATRHARLAYRQRGLFDAHADGTSPELAALVDRLTSELGRDAVVQQASRKEPQPERAFREKPLLDGLVPRRRSPRDEAFTTSRPTHLLPQPEPIAVLTVTPSGRLVQFDWKEQSHRIAQMWGPERVETGWWRSRGVWRDYYRVESTTGLRYWIFQRASDQQWFLHGLFD